MMKNKVLKDKVFIFIAIIQWVISFCTDIKIFNINLCSIANGIEFKYVAIYFILKAMFLVFLMIFWHVLFKWLDGSKSNEVVRKHIHFTAIYLGIMIAVFVVLWPGIWRWDEFSILDQAVNLNLTYWQHFLTSLFYIFSLMIFPAPGTIVAAQIVIMSAIVGYILALCSHFLKKSKLTYLLMIPFLLLPVIDNNFYPMRTSLYAYLELLFIFYIVHKVIFKIKINWMHIMFLASLTVILANWRSESIYYIILAPFIILVAFHKLCDLKKKLIYTILAIGLSLAVLTIQNHGAEKIYGQKYILTSVINPLSMMLQHDLEDNEETNDILNNIDKVMSVDILKDNPSPYGINAFYVKGLVRENTTDEDYHRFKKSYVKLVLNNLDVFIKYRLETLLATSGQYPDIRINIYDSSSIFDVNETNQHGNSTYEKFNQYPLTKPLFLELRKKGIRWLESRDISNIEKATATYGIYYNLIPIFIGLLILLGFMIIRKSKLFTLYILGLLLKFLLIFVTAPAKLFMYYFPIYLSTVFLVTLVIVGLIYEYRKKEKLDIYV